MTPPSFPPVPGRAASSSGDPVGLEVIAGLAREVDGLRRTLTATTAELGGLPERVDELARLLGQLADTVAASTARPGPVAAPSWLLAPSDAVEVSRLVGELCAWLHAVFLRYPDGATVLPVCWLRHPDVVEELLWLMHAWCQAYQSKAASVQLAADWHDRQRPGVVKRLRVSVGSCSVERHQTRPGWDQHPTGATPVPGAQDQHEIAALAEWWAARRDDPAPEPATQLIDMRNGRAHP